MALLKKHFIKLLISILFIKLILLFWSAHPFDFWAFVNTFQRNSLYGWNVFEYWNKGNSLIAIWYPFYAIYFKILIFTKFQADNLLLLHLFFKIPFLFIDIYCAYLVYKIITNLYDTKRALIGCIAWFVNPIIFYTYGVHGNYELLVPFSLLLLFYGLLKKRILYITVGLVLALSTKYFIIILLPFVLLYIYINKVANLGRIIFFTIFGTLISFGQVFFFHKLANQILASIIHLSVSNSPLGISKLQLSPLNIFSAINHIFNTNSVITNIDNPFLFNQANSALPLVAVVILLYFAYRSITVIKSKVYSFINLLNDFFRIIITFLVFSTNFQIHYSSWLIPFFIIFIFSNKIYVSLFAILTTFITVFALKSEFGMRTFFLDIFKVFDPTFLNDFSSKTKYQLGALIVLTLLLALIFNFFRIKESLNKSFRLYFFIVSILWIFLTVPYVQAITKYVKEGTQNHILAYAGETTHPGIIFANYKEKKIFKGKIFFNNTSTNDSLVLEGLFQNNNLNRNLFKVIILINNNDLDVEDLKFVRLNDSCYPKLSDSVYNYFDRKYYPGLTFNADCLLEHDNYISVYDNSKYSLNDFELYIINSPVTYSISSDKITSINILFWVGIIYLLIFIFSTLKMIKFIRLQNAQLKE